MPSPSEASSSRHSSPVSVEEEEEWKLRGSEDDSSSNDDDSEEGESNDHEEQRPAHSSPTPEQTSSADGQPGQDDNSADDDQDEEEDEEEEQPVTFESLGLIKPLLTAIERLKYKHPTDIQQAALPLALAGRDIIGVAATGSGKTAAFALPILQKLWEEPKGLFAVVLTPTRELAYQIAEQFEALGSAIEVRCAVIVGGMDMVAQAIALSKRPHVVVATPGRLQDHLENTKGFNLRYLKFLVMDEADRLLDMNFGPAMDKIFKVLPKDRHTYLFSATMTTRVEKLQRASLSNPARVEVNHKYSTVSTLLQHYIFIPLTHKDAYLVHLVNELAQNSMIIFTRTVQDSQRLALVLRKLGFPAIPIHGKLSQESRLGALNKFKTGGRSILVATDVASRGLDIPAVDVVINFDIPTYSKDYIHRVGRTARAGRAGKSITLVTQYDVELFQRIEGVIGKKMVEFVVDKEQVMLLKERVAEANRTTVIEMKEDREAGGGLYGTKRKREDGEGGGGGGGKGRDNMDRDDDEYQAGVSRRPRGRGGRGMVRGGRGGRGGRGRGRGRW